MPQLQMYVELGGDPAILLAATDSRSRHSRSDEPALESAEEDEPIPEASAERAELPSPPACRRRRFVLVAGAALVAAVAAAALVVINLRGGSDGPMSTWTETTGTPAHT